MRIVSLLPSATEIVCDLGLGRNLVGVSHECDYPCFVSDLPKVTRSVIPKHASSAEIDCLVSSFLSDNKALYLLDLELLHELRPDIIVTQALCDVCAVSADDVESAVCALPGTPSIVNLEPSTLDDVFRTMVLVGEAAGLAGAARRRVLAHRARLDAVVSRTESIRRNWPRVLMLEWIDPPFNAGHWNPELIAMAGGIDCLGSAGQPSRRLSHEEIQSASPNVLFIACCGFTTERTLEDVGCLHRYPGWHSLPCAEKERVYICGGNAFFSRPGPRLVDGLEVLAHALHPDTQPRPETPALRLAASTAARIGSMR